MMQRMHCTFTEFREQPLEEMCIFQAFMRGEYAAKEMIKTQQAAEAAAKASSAAAVRR